MKTNLNKILTSIIITPDLLFLSCFHIAFISPQSTINLFELKLKWVRFFNPLQVLSSSTSILVGFEMVKIDLLLVYGKFHLFYSFVWKSFNLNEKLDTKKPRWCFFFMWCLSSYLLKGIKISYWSLRFNITMFFSKMK